MYEQNYIACEIMIDWGQERTILCISVLFSLLLIIIVVDKDITFWKSLIGIILVITFKSMQRVYVLVPEIINSSLI